MNHSLVLLLLPLGACSAPTDDSGASDESYVDERMTPDDYADAPSDATVFTGADVVIEPGSDIMWCLAGTYTGDDVGIVDLGTYQGEYGHHFQIFGTTQSALDLPDGTVWDCTSSNDFPMADLQPIAFATSSNRSDVSVTIPDGFAVKMDANQRFVLQSHYVNVGTEPIRVQDVAVMSGIPTEEVETWAAPFYFNHEVFDLPAAQATHSAFDVVLEQDLNFLMMFGHMHEWGTSFATQVVEGDSVSDLYSVSEWDPSYRDAAPFNSYEPGELTLHAGQTIRESCDWFNDTEAAIDFPHEMCVTVGLVYPFTAAVGYSD
jgi:hypothetical protein